MTCTSGTDCSACIVGYTDKTNECFKKVANCKTQDGATCSACTDNLFVLKDNKCGACDPNCIKCAVAGECDASKCKAGYYLDAKKCVACPTNCATCSSKTVCLTCKSKSTKGEKSVYFNLGANKLCTDIDYH